jgi:hypothetical protein
MYIILKEAYESGARPALQSWTDVVPPKGYAFCPDEFVEVFYSTDPAGFVNITVENDIVTSMTVNQEALDAYIATMPEPAPEPEPVENVNYNDLASAIIEGVNEI